MVQLATFQLEQESFHEVESWEEPWAIGTKKQSISLGWFYRSSGFSWHSLINLGIRCACLGFKLVSWWIIMEFVAFIDSMSLNTTVRIKWPIPIWLRIPNSCYNSCWWIRVLNNQRDVPWVMNRWHSSWTTKVKTLEIGGRGWSIKIWAWVCA